MDIFAIERVASTSWRFLLLNDLFIGLILPTRFRRWLLLAKRRYIDLKWSSLCFLIFCRWRLSFCLRFWRSMCLLRMFILLELLRLTDNLSQWLGYLVAHLLLALGIDRTGRHARYIEYFLYFLQAAFSTVFSRILFIVDGIIHRVLPLKRKQTVNHRLSNAWRYTEIQSLVAQLLANPDFVHEGEFGDGVEVGYFVLARLRLVHRVE